MMLCKTTDQSDEFECKMLVIKENYNSKIPPFEFNFNTQRIDPVNVSISVFMLDILKLTEVDHQYVLKYIFIMEWYDYRCVRVCQ